MRRLFPAVPPSSSPSSGVQCPRRVSSLSIVAKRHACHDARKDASSANNLGSCERSRSSVVTYSSSLACSTPQYSRDLRSVDCNAHFPIVPRPGSCVKQRIEGAFDMLVILMLG